MARRLPRLSSLIAALTAGLILTSWTPSSDGFASLLAQDRVLPATDSAGGEITLPGGLVAIADQVTPAVVNVEITRIVRRFPMPPFPFLEDPQFWQFFGEQFPDHLQMLEQFVEPLMRRERQVGSGVIVRNDGLILTNYHVVEDALEIVIGLSDGREYRAQVLGADPLTDLAVLSIEAENLPFLPFGDSSAVHVGEFALAIGNPFGVGQTVTLGIVGGTGRGGFGLKDYEDFIQTDAAINPGSSGGALVNLHGELIGINTAMVSPLDGAAGQGLGFAIPTNMARLVMDQILSNGKVIHGWMGLVLQPVTKDIASAFDLPPTTQGALISDVVPDGPAARAGITRGDIVTAYNGRHVTDDRDLELSSAMSEPGSEATLGVLRNGRQEDITLVLGERPIEDPGAPNPVPPDDPSVPRFGISVALLTPEAAAGLQIPPEVSGVVVEYVHPASLAEGVGLRPGDVIEEVNRRPVGSVETFNYEVSSAGPAVLLLANRGGIRRYVVLRED